MQRRVAEIKFEASQLAELKMKMLNWSSRFGISLFQDSNSYPDPYGRYECLIGAGAAQLISADDSDAFETLQKAWISHHDWLFGHLAYDLKNQLEPHLSSRHEVRFGFASLQFFVPEVVCFIPRSGNILRIEALHEDPQEIAGELLAAEVKVAETLPQLTFRSRLSQQQYLEKIAALKQHIRDGDCYEITFCNEAFAEGISIDALSVFNAFNKTSPAPFSAFYRDGSRFMMCASPERFLQKEETKIRSQPIKGTARRSSDIKEDEQLKKGLYESEKERAENVMIVDLVRNDLARTCKVGSVKVDELFGIYSFPKVHQMISTISGELLEGISFADAIKMAFPMGSMTGAPKHRVMQLIDQYEVARRELFSGSVGYINPAGDFDFNVVIRSLFYNAKSKYLSYQTGGAITWGSDPEQEWNEVRLKAEAMERLFSGS